MKTFATFLLAAVLSITHTAQAADTNRMASGSLEIVLDVQQKETETDGTNYLFVHKVVFSAATNITMQVCFRNIGEVNLFFPGLLSGLTVIWDGKECKTRDPNRYSAYQGFAYLRPKRVGRESFSMSDFLIPTEALTSGRHTVAVKDAGVESNTQIILIEPQK